MKFSTGTLKITLFSKRTNDFIYSQYFYKEAKTVKEITAFAKNKFIDCKVRFDMQYGMENITVKFNQSDEDTNYNADQLKQIIKVQQRFKTRKLLQNFDYYVEGTKFNFKIYWLKTKSLLLFKIFMYGEVQLNISSDITHAKQFKRVGYQNPNDQTFLGSFCDRNELMPDSLSRMLQKQVSMMIVDDQSMIETSKFKTEHKILYQNLKISVQEVLPESDSEATRQKVNKMLDFIIRKKICYDGYFYFEYFEKREIADLLFPVSPPIPIFLWNRFSIEELSLRSGEFHESSRQAKLKASDHSGFNIEFDYLIEMENQAMLNMSVESMDMKVDTLQLDFEAAGQFLPPEINLERSVKDDSHHKKTDQQNYDVETPSMTKHNRTPFNANEPFTPITNMRAYELLKAAANHLNRSTEKPTSQDRTKNPGFEDLHSKYDEGSLESSRVNETSIKTLGIREDSKSPLVDSSKFKLQAQKMYDTKENIITFAAFVPKNLIDQDFGEGPITRSRNRKVTRTEGRRMSRGLNTGSPVASDKIMHESTPGSVVSLRDRDLMKNRSRTRSQRKIKTYFSKLLKQGSPITPAANTQPVKTQLDLQGFWKDTVEEPIIEEERTPLLNNETDKSKNMLSLQKQQPTGRAKKIEVQSTSTKKDFKVSDFRKQASIVISPAPGPQSSDLSSINTLQEINNLQEINPRNMKVRPPQKPHNFDIESKLQKIAEVSSVSNQNLDSISKRSGYRRSKEGLDVTYNPDGTHGSFLLKKRNSKQLALNLKPGAKVSSNSNSLQMSINRSRHSSVKSINSSKKSKRMVIRKVEPKYEERILDGLNDDRDNITSVEKPLADRQFGKKDESSSKDIQSSPLKVALHEEILPVFPQKNEFLVKTGSQQSNIGLQINQHTTNFRKPIENNKMDRTYNITVNESSDASIGGRNDQQSYMLSTQNQPSRSQYMPFQIPTQLQVNRKFSSFSAAVMLQVVAHKQQIDNTLLIDETVMSRHPDDDRRYMHMEYSSPNAGVRRSMILNEIDDIENVRQKLKHEVESKQKHQSGRRKSNMNLYD